jgi:hypothetical protein
MAGNRIGTRIESLIEAGEWASAQGVIEKQLAKEPADHWLWARLAGVKYERRDYQGALDAAEKSLDRFRRSCCDGWGRIAGLTGATSWRS